MLITFPLARVKSSGGTMPVPVRRITPPEKEFSLGISGRAGGMTD
jgi:hypothetical protein